MKYSINPDIYRDLFAVPSSIPDRFIKLASHAQLKTILYILKNGIDSIDDTTAAKLDISTDELNESLIYWTSCSILKNEQNEKVTASEQNDTAKVIVKHQKPDREQVAQRASQSKSIAFALQQAQIKFGRPLRHNESSTFVSLIDDEGMNSSVLLMLIEFAARENQCNLSFIERTAVKWISSGINTVSAAEKEIIDMKNKRAAWGIVCNSMGIEHRQPSAKEQNFAVKWITEWNYDPQMLKLAYDACIDATGKYSSAYVNTVLENWHSKGIHTPSEVEIDSENYKNKDSDKPSYDLDSIDKLLRRNS